MRYFIIVILFLLSGCAVEGPYGIPSPVWKTLTPQQKQAIIEYDAKHRNAEQKNWIWKNSTQPQAPASKK